MRTYFNPEEVHLNDQNFDPDAVGKRFNLDDETLKKLEGSVKVKKVNSEKLKDNKKFIIIRNVAIGGVAIIAGTALFVTVANYSRGELGKPYFARSGYMNYNQVSSQELYSDENTSLDELQVLDSQPAKEFEKLDSLLSSVDLISQYRLDYNLSNYNYTPIDYAAIDASEIEKDLNFCFNFDTDLLNKPENPETRKFLSICKLLLDVKQSVIEYERTCGQQVVDDYAKQLFATDVIDSVGLDCNKVTNIDMDDDKILVTCDGVTYSGKIDKKMLKELNSGDTKESMRTLKHFISIYIEGKKDIKVRH